ncbi:MAG: hypothetical protein NDI94_01740 [Candidatus Woesearchaeota archaeon]|nr:hypothetical protein [Candidatus Woesearchaeota archaeon]
MIDKKNFEKIRKELEARDVKREDMISRSREIGKASKQAIYAIHRKDMTEAAKLIEKAKKQMSSCEQYVGAYDSSLQEYAEAAAYFGYMQGKLPTAETLGIDIEDYLSGLCDLTGELARRAVFSVVEEDFKEVEKVKEIVSEIYEEFLKFDLRNGELRKKSDSIKWNLKKIEEVLYDLKIRGKL